MSGVIIFSAAPLRVSWERRGWCLSRPCFSSSPVTPELRDRKPDRVCPDKGEYCLQEGALLPHPTPKTSSLKVSTKRSPAQKRLCQSGKQKEKHVHLFNCLRAPDWIVTLFRAPLKKPCPLCLALLGGKFFGKTGCWRFLKFISIVFSGWMPYHFPS